MLKHLDFLARVNPKIMANKMSHLRTLSISMKYVNKAEKINKFIASYLVALLTMIEMIRIAITEIMLSTILLVKNNVISV
jgi:hypothetical protein